MDDVEFWADLESIEDIFDRLSKLVAVAEAKDTTISKVFGGLLSFASYLISASDEQESRNRALNDHYRVTVLRSFLLYFHRLDLDLMFAASIIDPNVHYRYLTNEAVKRGKTRLAVYLFKMGHSDQAAHLLKNELERYEDILETLGEEIVDLRSWWKAQEFTFLNAIALRLCFIPNSANTERVFSALKIILSPRRNRLDISTVFDTITVKMHVATRANGLPVAVDKVQRPGPSSLLTSSVEELPDEDSNSQDVDLMMLDSIAPHDLDEDDDDGPELECYLDGLCHENMPAEDDEVSHDTMYADDGGRDVFSSAAYESFRTLIDFERLYFDSNRFSQSVESNSQTAEERARAIFGD